MPTDARERLLAAITRLEDRHYTYYPKDNLPALLSAALQEEREEQRKADAQILWNMKHHGLTEWNATMNEIAAAILRGAEPESGGEEKR